LYNSCKPIISGKLKAKSRKLGSAFKSLFVVGIANYPSEQTTESLAKLAFGFQLSTFSLKKQRPCDRLPQGLCTIPANLNPNLNRKKFYYPGVKVVRESGLGNTE
jgi:hypothetical protein